MALSYAILGTHHGPAHQPAGDGQPVPARELPDLGAIERLLKQVRARTVDTPDRLDLMAPTVRRTVGEWLEATHRSTALRSRLEPAGFGELSVAQACLVVSALIAAVTSATTKGER